MKIYRSIRTTSYEKLQKSNIIHYVITGADIRKGFDEENLVIKLKPYSRPDSNEISYLLTEEIATEFRRDLEACSLEGLVGEKVKAIIPLGEDYPIGLAL